MTELYGEQWGMVLLLSFLLTWGIGLAPPLLIRFAIMRRTIRKGWALGIVALFWVFNFSLFMALGGGSKSSKPLFVSTLVACVSYTILTKQFTNRTKRIERPTKIEGVSPKVHGDKMSDSVTDQTHFFRSADGAKENESSNKIGEEASPKVNSNKMSYLATGPTRFSRSAAGVITDIQTGLQWLSGPDRETDYKQAEHCAASLTVAGGGWRLPTCEELKTLYDPSCEFHISPLFNATGMRWVWAEPYDSSSAWYFDFSGGNDRWIVRDNAYNGRVLAVRLRTTPVEARKTTHVSAREDTNSTDGMITDSVTNLQWLPGPDQDTDYKQAKQWVASQTVAGGGWRMPTREELKTLYDPSCEFHISPPFNATGMRWLWAEPRDSSSAWTFDFNNGGDNYRTHDSSYSKRVFAVRPRR